MLRNPPAGPFQPLLSCPAAATLVVFASQQDRNDYVDAGGNLHTNFALRSAGDYLALVAPDGATVVSGFSPGYPEQKEDVAYGLNGFFLAPTPGAPNEGGGVIGFVEDTTFSMDRGFYETAISVAITTATPDAGIYYTTDGTEPSPANGTLYHTPLTIDTTTTLRAAAFKEGLAPTNIDTQTYLFLEDVVRQPARHPRLSPHLGRQTRPLPHGSRGGEPSPRRPSDAGSPPGLPHPLHCDRP